MCKKDAKIAKNNRLNFLSYRTYLRFLFRYYWKHNVKQLFMSKLIPIWVMYFIVETICYFIRSQFIWLGNLEKLNWDIIWYYRFILSTKAQKVPDSVLWFSIPFEVDSNFEIILTLCPLVFVSKPQQLRPTLHTSIDKLYSCYYVQL